MRQAHPIFGDMVERDERIPDGRWMVRDSNVPLDTLINLLDNGSTTEEILKRHILILRRDLVEIAMLHALSSPSGSDDPTT